MPALLIAVRSDKLRRKILYDGTFKASQLYEGLFFF